MKYKQFFKFTASKIVITIILLLMPFYRQVICGDFVMPIRCFTRWYSAFSIFLESINNSRLDVGIPVLLISIIIAYVISSIIMWIFNKSKRKGIKSR